MEGISPVVGVTDKKRLLSTDEYQEDTHTVLYDRLPVGTWLIERVGVLSRLNPAKKKKFYQMTVLVLTFCCYASLHMARMTISVVKSTLHPDCNSSGLCANPSNNCAGWEPFDEPEHGKTLLGALDYAWLFPYAIAMFFSGQIADKSNLRYFLTIGMLGSALSVGLFGMGYFWNVHQLYYFILVQIFGGVMQSTGWPGVVAVMANWFGKGRRGLIMGVWNSHTGVGNLLGVLIPGIWAHHHWGWSFLSAAFTMIFIIALIFTFLVIDPTHVGLMPPQHYLESERKFASQMTSDSSLLADQQKKATSTRTTSNNEEKAVGFLRALLIPGVMEFAFALFFSKLVSYAFLFWLPFYIINTRIGPHCLNTFQSGALATMFDVGAMIGGAVAGLVSDLLQARAFTSAASLVLAIPSLYLFKEVGHENLAVAIVLMIITGIFVNGPYAMITTAVSADLGTHKSLKNSQKAKATVTAIIDGTGSIGGAIGPFLTGLLVSKEGWDSVFYLFMLSSLIAALILSRLIYGEVKVWRSNIAARHQLKDDDTIRMSRKNGSTSDAQIEETELID